jgi:hypothetical protein
MEPFAYSDRQALRLSRDSRIKSTWTHEEVEISSGTDVFV